MYSLRACVLYRDSSLHKNPALFFCAFFLKEGKEEDTREKKMKKKGLIP